MFRTRWAALVAGGVVGLSTASASAAMVQIKVENLSPYHGVFFTPVWAAVHDGSFDLFDAGDMASPALEAIAEDGVADGLNAALGGAGSATLVTAPAGFPGAPVFDPGDVSTATINVADPAVQRWFSFASMIIPSNDAFIGNPAGIEIFDASGQFHGKRIITILGSQVWDAGTEANTEMDAAFLNQAAPNTGTSTSDPIALHAGFIDSVGNPGGTPHILGGTNGAGVFFDAVAADFTLPNAVVARITIVPEPASAALLGLGTTLMLKRRRRQSH